MEKALAVLGSPKSLLDFLWYYEAYGKKKYEYDLLILPAGMDLNGNWSVRIYDFALNTGIFHEITIYDGTYIDKGLWLKIKTVIDMGWNAILRRQPEYCAKVLKPWIDCKRYKQIVTVFLPTIFSGELVVLSKYLEVVLLEDGARDYEPHRSWPTRYWIKREGWQYEIAGCILSKLGYADTTTMYNFAPTKRCVKFSSRPEKLLYRDYKEIFQLNDMSLVDKKAYQALVEKTFDYDVTGVQADYALFTAPLKEDLQVDEKITQDFVRYIVGKMGKGRLLLKKHPRDEMSYQFPDGVEVIEVPKNVPAELLLGILNGTQVYFTYPSTIMQEMRASSPKILFDSKEKSGTYNPQRILDAMKTIEFGSEYLIDIYEDKAKDRT